MAAFGATTLLVLPALTLAGTAQKSTSVLEAKALSLATKSVTTGWGRTLSLALPTEMVGFEWQGRQKGALEVRDPAQGEWLHVDGDPAEGPDPGTVETHVDRTTAGPIWVGTGVRRLQVRVVEG